MDKKVNTLAIVLGVVAGVSTAFAVYFGIQNANYLSDWKKMLADNSTKGLNLTNVKYLPKTV